MKRKILLVVCVVVLIGFILEVKSTYSLFETNGTGDVELETASWKIKVNNIDVTQFRDISSTFDLGNINWVSNGHVKDGYGAPGLTGSLSIDIDPMDTDVSFVYELTFDFSNIDNEEFLIDSVSVTNGGTIIRTGKYSYTGIVPLSEIQQKKVYNVVVSFVWNNQEENNYNDYLLGIRENVEIPVRVHLLQYKNTDTITEYVEGSA